MRGFYFLKTAFLAPRSPHPSHFTQTSLVPLLSLSGSHRAGATATEWVGGPLDVQTCPDLLGVLLPQRHFCTSPGRVSHL